MYRLPGRQKVDIDLCFTGKYVITKKTVENMRFFLLLTAFLSVPRLMSAQGCSDAGFCTMGAMKPDQHYNKRVDFKLRSIELNAYKGITSLSPVIHVYTADMTFGLNDRTSFQVKIPYQMVKGNLGKTAGLGDISISATRTLLSTERGSLHATIGTKIPSNPSNLENKKTEFGPGGDLPMYYQVSLGSYDLVAGASWISNNWLFATGIQVPLTKNRNDFRWGQWPDYPNQKYLRDYALANNLHRGTDVMLRVERNFRFTNFNFNIGLLPIYRIARDEVFNFNTGEREKPEGTTGLALSVLAGAGYHFNINNSVKLILGKKITNRELNPDGLTREKVMSMSYIYRF